MKRVSQSRRVIVLAANYLPDRQESMLRFARVLAGNLPALGFDVWPVHPPARLARSQAARGPAAKWLGYLDKYALFLPQLRAVCARADRASEGNAVLHVCDHSNAPYVAWAGGIRTVVTCHDLLAVRGALGEDTDCPASPTGRILQRWILRSLRRADEVACVSRYTLGDLDRLLPGAKPARRCILNGLNHPYHPLAPAIARERVARDCPQLGHSPFLLHVGSSLKRKNREGILRIVGRMATAWAGKIVFVGNPLEPSQQHLADSLGLRPRIVEIEEAPDDLLQALYARAFALLFPSRFEGFGWPIIEAQACGCPVLASNRCSVPEVAGNGAVVLDADDEAGFAKALLQLQDPAVRTDLVERGRGNVERFGTDRMIRDYARLYEELERT